MSLLLPHRVPPQLDTDVIDLGTSTIQERLCLGGRASGSVVSRPNSALSSRRPIGFSQTVNTRLQRLLEARITRLDTRTAATRIQSVCRGKQSRVLFSKRRLQLDHPVLDSTPAAPKLIAKQIGRNERLSKSPERRLRHSPTKRRSEKSNKAMFTQKAGTNELWETNELPIRHSPTKRRVDKALHQWQVQQEVRDQGGVRHRAPPPLRDRVVRSANEP